MFPELLKLGPITLKTYGFFAAMGFLVTINYLKYQSKKYCISQAEILDLSLYILVSGLIGARVFYVLLNWEFYKANLVEIFYIWSGGLVWYGGLIFGFIISLIYAINKKLNFLLLADLFAPAIPLGLAIGRIGCFSAGCCYGKPTNLFFGVRFTNPASLIPASALGLKLHPTQIYESVFCFLLFVFLHVLSERKRVGKPISEFSLSVVEGRRDDQDRPKKFDGEIFLISMIAYSLWRFLIEFLRWDDRGAKVFGLFPSQFIAIIIFLISTTAFIVLNRKWKKNLKL